jgi:uncharacterized membrane protein
MNKMLVVLFDEEAAAEAGLQALHKLHSEGEITLYAEGVIEMDAVGKVGILASKAQVPGGVCIGLAVNSLMGLLGGPMATATMTPARPDVSAVRAFWMVGVGLDFIEEARAAFQPGKLALVAEIEEDWITPTNIALGSEGGHVIRRTRMDVAERDFDHAIAALKSELAQLKAEVSHANGADKLTLEGELEGAKGRLDVAIVRAKQRLVVFKAETDQKSELLTSQLSNAKGDVRARVEDRVKSVKRAYHARGDKLSQAWELTKEALAI